MKNINPQEQLILTLVNDGIFTKKHLVKIQLENCRTHGGNFFRSIDLLKTYHKLVKIKKVKVESGIEKLLTVKHVRSLSGIVVVSVLTKPYPCPGKCLYCPTEKNVPKSYLSNEPAVMRAISLNYDPFVQTFMRLKALEMEGHPTDKINIRVIGGTWSYYPKNYQNWFIKRVFEACNNFESLKHNNIKTLEQNNNTFKRGMSPEQEINLVEASLEGKSGSQAHWKVAPATAPIERTSFSNKRAKLLTEIQSQNETAKNRIVEISIETRQDFINEKEIKHLRNLGVTKVEMGVQSIYDDILKLNRRGHTVKETIHATKLLKDAGFKVSYQMMLNLHGSNIKRDKKMFEELFRNPDFKPDHLKIYPLALVKNSGLYKFYNNDKYKPYTKEQLIKLLTNIKKEIPYYCRIERIIRDIPAESIVEGGTKFSNMRQILQKEKIFCKCIRCREVKDHLNTRTLKHENNKTFNQKIERGMSPEQVPVEVAIGDRVGWLRVAKEKATSERNNDNIYLFKEIYSASDGKEIFLSIENCDRSKLFSLLRLRIPSQVYENKKHFLKVLEGSAIIREIHTYGQQIRISTSGSAAQHKGLGKLLIQTAEKITKEFRLKKISVIAGIGVRKYFERLGYKLRKTYMIKIF